jgi:hypothetical protein
MSWWSGPALRAAPAPTGLARHGVDTWLVDKEPFPRDKTCGDGLIPDSLAALRRLGALDEVMAVAQPVAHVGCIGPRGGRIDVPGTMAVLRRSRRHPVPHRAGSGRSVRRAVVLRGPAAGSGRAGGRRRCGDGGTVRSAAGGWCWPRRAAAGHDRRRAEPAAPAHRRRAARLCPARRPGGPADGTGSGLGTLASRADTAGSFPGGRACSTSAPGCCTATPRCATTARGQAGRERQASTPSSPATGVPPT